jgi:hypothetical protein
MSRRATDHAACIRTHGVDLAGALIDRDHRGLERHNAAADLINDSIRRA